MNAHYFEPKADWKEQAKILFFVDHLGVGEIAKIVSKARETVFRLLSQCEEYEQEKFFRKQRSTEKRKAYQKDWDRLNRPNRYSQINGETILQEHEIAVRILSHEKYR